MSRRARLSASKSSAPVVVTTGRRAPAHGSPSVASDRRRDRPDATLIEASVTARLLGLRILRLDATVALVPADVRVAPPPVHGRAAYAPARPSADSPRRAAPAGGDRLVDAVRNLDEGSRLLAKVHRDGV
jgi:hypothetical protein